MGNTLGLYGDNGKGNGSNYGLGFRAILGIMEKKMETTGIIWASSTDPKPGLVNPRKQLPPSSQQEHPSPEGVGWRFKAGIRVNTHSKSTFPTCCGWLFRTSSS